MNEFESVLKKYFSEKTSNISQRLISRTYFLELKIFLAKIYNEPLKLSEIKKKNLTVTSSSKFLIG